MVQEICLPGDQRIVGGMLLALRNSSAHVRKMAVDVILKVAHPGDEQVVAALADSLTDENSDVRQAVVDCIK